MARKKEPEKAASHERWLVSYADFITLLFAFFVVMFATSNSSQELRTEYAVEVKKAFDSFGVFGLSGGRAQSLGATDMDGDLVITIDTGPGGLQAPAGSGESNDDSESDKDYPVTTDVEPPEDDFWDNRADNEPLPDEGPAIEEFEHSPGLQILYDELKALLDDELAESSIQMRQEKRGIVISLSEAGFFDSGSAALKSTSLAAIDRIAGKLRRLDRPFDLRIEGHTDNVPLSPGSRHRNNRELSTARANSVIEHLIRRHGFPPRHLIASGYGEFRPIVRNTTAEGRGRNRRVDIVILNEEYAGLEAPTPITP